MLRPGLPLATALTPAEPEILIKTIGNIRSDGF